jgi:hypothetical protein
MWGLFEWMYRSVLNKRRELYELSRSGVEHWKDLAKRTAAELTEKVKQLDEQTEMGRQIMTLSLRLTTELDQLGQANALSKPSATRRAD